MADPVSSFFVDQGLLGMLPQDRAQSAADQASKTFWLGLLGTGNPFEAYQAAQQSGYNTINHAIQLQQHQLAAAEAARKAAETKLRQGAQRESFVVAPGTGVGTSDPLYAPRNDAGEVVAGPGYIPPKTQFDEVGYANRLLRAGIASQDEIKMALPNIEFVNGIAMDKRNTKPGTFVPSYDKGTMPIRINPQTGMPEGVMLMQGQLAATEAMEGAKEGAKARYQFSDITNADGSTTRVSAAKQAEAEQKGKPYTSAFVPKLDNGVIPLRGKDGRILTDANGNIIYGNAPGVVKATGQTEGAKANAKEAAAAAYDLIDATLPDGTKVKVTREQARQLATKPGANGQITPITSEISPQAKSEREGAGTFNIKEVLSPAKAAADAALKSNQNLALLTTTLKNAPLNQITATDTVQRLAGYAKAAGVLTDQAAGSVSNLAALRSLVSASVLQEQLAQKGPQTESDARRMEETIQGKGDKDATQFLIAAKMAQNKRAQEYYSHLDKFRRDNNGTLDGADEAWVKGKGGESIFRAPELRQYAKQRKGVDGKMYYDFEDGPDRPAIPVSSK